jgi:hypothetical protein
MQYGMFHVKRILNDDNNFEITVSSMLMGFSSGHGVFTSCIPRGGGGTVTPHLGKQRSRQTVPYIRCMSYQYFTQISPSISTTHFRKPPSNSSYCCIIRIVINMHFVPPYSSFVCRNFNTRLISYCTSLNPLLFFPSLLLTDVSIALLLTQISETLYHLSQFHRFLLTASGAIYYVLISCPPSTLIFITSSMTLYITPPPRSLGVHFPHYLSLDA